MNIWPFSRRRDEEAAAMHAELETMRARTRAELEDARDTLRDRLGEMLERLDNADA